MLKLSMRNHKLSIGLLLPVFLFLISSCCEITGDCNTVEPEPEPIFNGTGLEPTPASQLQGIPFATPPSSGGLPNSVDLSGDMPPVGNQGSSNSCVGWAVAYGLKSYQEKIEFGHNYFDNNQLNRDHVFSPTYVYNQIKLGNCGGSYIISAFNLLQNQGVCSWNAMPFTMNDCENQPNNNQVQAAVNQKIISYERVNVNDENDMKTFLHNGFPIVIGMALDQAFNNANDNNGEYIWSSNSTPITGQHAMVIVGYDDARNAYKALNSWGTQWGNDGYIWIEYSHFESFVSEGFIAKDNLTNNDTKEIDVTGSLNFGNVAVGQQAVKSFKIRNRGLENLTVSSISIPNGYSLDWTNGVIQPNNEITVSITFSPQTIGSYNGTVNVNSDAQIGNNSISITGSSGNSNVLQFTDSRDGQTYEYVQIGNMFWMAENLNYQTSNSLCYDNSNYFCNQYGQLYNGTDAMQGANFSNGIPSGVQGICPNGWHLPSKYEWQLLIDEFDDGNVGNGTQEIYNTLIENGSSGFEALLGGYTIWTGLFENEGVSTKFWSSSEYSWGIPEAFFISSNSQSAIRTDSGGSMMYCRCIQD